MTTTQRARSFAKQYRELLVTRACRRATRRLGRALTPEEHFSIVIAVRTFLPPARRCKCGKRAVAGDTACMSCREDERAGIFS